jgi:hypothetical protein
MAYDKNSNKKKKLHRDSISRAGFLKRLGAIGLTTVVPIPLLKAIEEAPVALPEATIDWHEVTEKWGDPIEERWTNISPVTTGNIWFFNKRKWIGITSRFLVNVDQPILNTTSYMDDIPQFLPGIRSITLECELDKAGIKEKGEFNFNDELEFVYRDKECQYFGKGFIGELILNPDGLWIRLRVNGKINTGK